MKKVFLILLVICLVYISGCQATGTQKDSSQGFDYDRFQVTQEEIDVQHQKYGKKYCEATIYDDFEIGRIIIKVYPFANHVEYTADDFAEVGCTGIYALENVKEDVDKPTRSFIIEIRGSTKQAVLDAIETLEKRADIYIAEPNYIYYPAVVG